MHYSFYGSSVRKTPEELLNDGVWLCMAKCPNSEPIICPWHKRHGKIGTDFTYIYKMRKDWWFTDTYITSNDLFLEYFNIIGKHIPTTGFQCILEISDFDCKSIYITGFDFFLSGKHNVDEPWKSGNVKDPIGHVPNIERLWLSQNKERYILDERLNILL